MPFVTAHGNDLRAGKGRFVAYGFGYSGAFGESRLYSFRDSSDAALGRYLAGMREARESGANALRIYLQLFDFIRLGPNGVEVRDAALSRLREVIAAAEDLHLYLDLTGNLVWVPGSSPGRYDRMSARERWHVQARFWRAIASVAEPSPAVLCYELTSEPAITTSSPDWYRGSFGGLNFVQLVVRDAGARDAEALAREWIRTLTAAIRSHDRRHLIGIGLLPFAEGPFGPGNVADLLDVLLVHIYPMTGEADTSVDIVRTAARTGKPVILGETAVLHSDLATQKRFLLRSRPYLDGYLSVINPADEGRAGGRMAAAIRKRAVAQFLSLRSRLLPP